MSFWSKLSTTWKISIFLIAFLIVAYAVVSFREWQADFTTWFLRTGQWEMILFVSLLGFAFVTILIKLLQWQFRKTR